MATFCIISPTTKISEQQTLEISGLLEETIQKTGRAQEEFLCNIFLLRKNGRNRPMIDLKKFNTFIPYENFKMEEVHCLKFCLE